MTFVTSPCMLPADEKNRKRMLTALKSKKSMWLWFYCVTDSKEGNLEIVPAWCLKQPGYPEVTVLGLASSRNNALELVSQMVTRQFAQ